MRTVALNGINGKTYLATNVQTVKTWEYADAADHTAKASGGTVEILQGMFVVVLPGGLATRAFRLSENSQESYNVRRDIDGTAVVVLSTPNNDHFVFEGTVAQVEIFLTGALLVAERAAERS